MSLFTHIKSILEQNENFAKDGEVFKNKVVEAALKLDPTLLSILLKDERAKSTFFQEVEAILVFDKIKFQKFISNKEFLPDSFTDFKNKIGLTANREYLTEAKEVVLDFPYKDCVLEGGQTKEDQKRQEIFWNKTLAPDEIDRLFDKKIFVNWKKIDKTGVSQPLTVDRKSSFILKGNNLITLHSLKDIFKESIKLIYIDPPYNTGGSNNTFAYNNTFNHSTWLTFMKNRLEVAKSLLTKDGFISIAIDHYELLHLGVLCDEIFGRENRIGIVSVVHKPEGRNQEKFFATSNEFMLVYAKDKSQANFTPYIIDKEKLEEYKYEDERGKYKLNNFLRAGGGDPNLRINKPHFFYPIFVNKTTLEIQLYNDENAIEVFPITNSGQERTWKTKKETFIEIFEKGELIAIRDKKTDKIEIFEKYRPEKGQLIKTHWIDKRYNAINQGTKIVNELIGENIFSYPKSIELIKDVIKIMTKPNDFVLDFFGGSGTTAHAVMECNMEDGGNRKFIICEQMDYFENATVMRNHKIIEKLNLNDEFYTAELASKKPDFLNLINSINTKEDVYNILEILNNKNLISYNVEINKIKEYINVNFLTIDITVIKEMLIEIVDFNNFYIPFYEIDDIDNNISEIDKKINNLLYL